MGTAYALRTIARPLAGGSTGNGKVLSDRSQVDSVTSKPSPRRNRFPVSRNVRFVDGVHETLVVLQVTDQSWSPPQRPLWLPGMPPAYKRRGSEAGAAASFPLCSRSACGPPLGRVQVDPP